jgi:hypothetical protein
VPRLLDQTLQDRRIFVSAANHRTPRSAAR